MTRANAELSLPPSDRDDAPVAPELELEFPRNTANAASDEIDAAARIERDRLRKLGHALTEALHDLLQLQAARDAGDIVSMDLVIDRLVENCEAAAPLARLIKRGLSRPRQPGEAKE
jgi:hypothetical protein